MVPATFAAVCAVTIVSYMIAYRMKLPPIVFAVLPVLPEIPGMYAIRGLQDAYLFATAHNSASLDLLLSANRYGGQALLIIFALITGILLPILLVDKKDPDFIKISQLLGYGFHRLGVLINLFHCRTQQTG